MSAKKNQRRRNRSKQPYRKSRAVDASCRCHGSCSYCHGNREHKAERLRSEPRLEELREALLRKTDEAGERLLALRKAMGLEWRTSV